MTTPGDLDLSDATRSRLARVAHIFPLRIPPHLLGLMETGNPRCPVRRQVVPDLRELEEGGRPDPLCEEPHQVAPGIIRRFEDRLLALVSSRCPVHCRHCNRKRHWTRPHPVAGPEAIARAVRGHRRIREVILSGGEPLMLSDARLDSLLTAARSSPWIEVVRIHTRMPCSHPARITPGLIRMLRRHRPLWLSIQFNHAKEVAPAVRGALLALRDAGIPLLNQAVLLRGINDSHSAQLALGRALVAVGVKPHYLFQLDRATGTLHFQVPMERASAIAQSLRSRVSGLCVPHLLLDLPGTRGKVPVCPGGRISKEPGGRLTKA